MTNYRTVSEGPKVKKSLFCIIQVKHTKHKKEWKIREGYNFFSLDWCRPRQHPGERRRPQPQGRTIPGPQRRRFTEVGNP